MLDLIADYGLALVFANVLLERVGLPLPAAPTLLLCAGVLGTHAGSVGRLFGTALAACVIGDTLWYFAGRIYGRRVLRLLCRVSLSPDSCVRATEDRFAHWGGLTLVLAKFVPGLSTVVRPLAGAMRLPLWSFELLNGLGSALWAAAAIGVGIVFRDQIGALLASLHDLGALLAEVALLALLVYVGLKWRQRQRLNRALSVARISVHELNRRLGEVDVPIVVDVRSRIGRDQDLRRIPGALEMTLEELPSRLPELPAQREIVFYCACPNEASAAAAARKLLDRGYNRVRPLLGGLDQWVAAGYAIENRSIAAILPDVPAEPF